MYNRRSFIKDSALLAGALATRKLTALADADRNAFQYLTILHTNDTHSRLEPFPMDGGRNQGLGGVAARAELVNEIRDTEQKVLLLDAGDIFQGTPYFNFFKGEPELRAMSAMGYDAATIGNHDFDGGIENLATQWKEHAKFPMIVSNYDFTNTPLEHIYKPYEVFRKGRLKIGVLGTGIELQGLVPENLYGNTRYLNPVEKANETAWLLKKKKNCDLVICLSHLGLRYDHNKVSDEILAKESEHIDLVIGGHTHSFLDEPLIIHNKMNQVVLINQVGWAGILLGRLDYQFEPQGKKKIKESSPISVTKKSV